MNSAKMIEAKQKEMEDAKGNHSATSSKLVRDFRGFLEQLALEIERDEHRAAKTVSKQRLEIKVLTELAGDRIISVDEASQIRVVSNDQNTVPHPQYSEWEPY